MASIRIPVDGLSKLASALSGGGDSAYNEAYQKEGLNQSRMAQAVASIRKDNAQASMDEGVLAARAPDAIRSNAMTNLGIPQDAAADVNNFLQSGKVGKYELPAGEQGPTMAKPEWFDKLGNIGRMIASTQNAITFGDKDSENVAKAYAVHDKLNKQDQAYAGKLDPSKLAQAVAAANGTKQVSAHEYGVVNDFTGAMDSNNDVAKRFGTYRNSETGKNKAQSASSYASANNSNASADYTKSKIGQSQTTTLPDGTVISQGSQGKPPQGFLWGATDPKTGQPTLVAIKGGPADKGSKIASEVQRQVGGIMSLNKTLFTLDEALKDFDPRSMDQLSAEKRAKITSIAKQAQLDAKEAAALGALSGPDMGLLEGILADPTSLKGFALGGKGVRAQLKEAQLGNERRMEALREQYGEGALPPAKNKPKPPPSGAVTIQNDAQYNALPSGATFIGPDGKQRRKP